MKTITNLNAGTTVYNNNQFFDKGVYYSPSIYREDGGDLSQALLQGWTWGGLDFAIIDSEGCTYESFVKDPLHTNFGGRYRENAWW